MDGEDEVVVVLKERSGKAGWEPRMARRDTGHTSSVWRGYVVFCVAVSGGEVAGGGEEDRLCRGEARSTKARL